MRAVAFSTMLLALFAVGCSAAAPSSAGEPRPLVGKRIPPGAGTAPQK
jgi:hypothetical protein